MTALVPLTLLRNYRLWNAGETAGFPEGEAAAMVAAGTAAPPGMAPEEEAPATPAIPPADLDGMTAAQLLALAADRGVEVGPRATKAELLAALQAAPAPQGRD